MNEEVEAHFDGLIRAEMERQRLIETERLRFMVNWMRLPSPEQPTGKAENTFSMEKMNPKFKMEKRKLKTEKDFKFDE